MSGKDKSKCYGDHAPGFNEFCYNEGRKQNGPGDPSDLGRECLVAALCSTNEHANRCYGLGAAKYHHDTDTRSSGCCSTQEELKNRRSPNNERR